MMQGVEDKTKPQKPRIAVSASIMAFGTLTSRVLGMTRDILLTAFFSRMITDSWLVAFRLPHLFRRLLGEGSLSVSFVPVLVRNLTRSDNRKSAQDLIDGLFSILLTVLIVLTTLGIIFAEEILALFIPGESYTSVPGKVDLTVRMAQIMFGFLLFVSLFAFFMSILNSHKHFALPALSPALLNVSIISGALIIHFVEGVSTDLLAWAVLFGGFLQMTALVPKVISFNNLPRWSSHWKNPDVLEVLRKMLPGIAGLAVAQVTILINTRYASYLPEGTNTWIFLADRILELPLSLFAVSVGTALLPSLSEHWAREESIEMRQTANRFLRLVLFLALPAAVGMYSLSEPLVSVLFQRGRFGNNDLIQTASVVAVYSGSAITYSMVRVIAPCFYAVGNTLYPAITAWISVVVHYFLAGYLIGPYGVKGLAISGVCVSGLNMFLLFIGYSKKVGELYIGRLIKSATQFLLACIPMYFVTRLYDDVESIINFKYLSLALIIFASAGVYFFAAHILKAEEVAPVLSRLKKRFTR